MQPSFYVFPGIDLNVKNQKINSIINTVSNHFNIPYESMKSKTRKREIMTARACAMYFMQIKTDLPLAIIGSYFCYKEHTAPRHAIHSFMKLIWGRESIRESVKEISEKI